MYVLKLATRKPQGAPYSSYRPSGYWSTPSAQSTAISQRSQDLQSKLRILSWLTRSRALSAEHSTVFQTMPAALANLGTQKSSMLMVVSKQLTTHPIRSVKWAQLCQGTQDTSSHRVQVRSSSAPSKQKAAAKKCTTYFSARRLGVCVFVFMRVFVGSSQTWHKIPVLCKCDLVLALARIDGLVTLHKERNSTMGMCQNPDPLPFISR